MTLARIGGTAAEPVGRVQLGEVLARAGRAVGGEAARHEVTLDLAAPAALATAGATVSGHAQDLERLFCNLFENAIRHSPHPGTIHVAASDLGARIAVHVRDHGPGVPDSDRERIFQPFFRSAAAYGTPGYGLGLAIARKVARAHGGELSLGPAGENHGAEFIVELPKV